MLESLLIANRGEIACRVIRTAQAMGLRTIAVYSDADRHAMHVAMADDAYHIGPASALESYLNADKVLAVAKQARASAIHPGYGFLSENAAFADACLEAGIVFVGPPSDAIRAMGQKHAASQRMADAGVPVLPGYRGSDQSAAALQAAANATGYPLIVKPSSGGGGKGMHIVNNEAELAHALERAAREANNAFGDPTLLLERYLERARHIEVQVFADQMGNTVHLFERDCSSQRRHQKIIEEAPAPHLSATQRDALGAVAVRAAQAIGYVGAGTVEFLLDASSDSAEAGFYFMEMNTRLQVEHPVTEAILGVDLVEWQLRVAAGEPLPDAAKHLDIRGHAIEARLYAEDPERGFLPAAGKLLTFSVDASAANHIRVDTGVRSGDDITVHYDPMIAKVVAWGEDREQARQSLDRALTNSRLEGPPSNLLFLSALLNNPSFVAGRIDTGYIDRGELELESTVAAITKALVVQLAAIWWWQEVIQTRSNPAAEPNSPWSSLNGWQMNHPVQQDVHVALDELSQVVRMTAGPEKHLFAIANVDSGVSQCRLLDPRDDAPDGQLPDGQLEVEIDGRRYRANARLNHATGELALNFDNKTHRLQMLDMLFEAEANSDAGGKLTAPMPGKILAVLVAEGERVEKGTPLLILEAMKMEHTITAPSSGSVERIHFQANELVGEGAELVTLATD